MEGKKCTIHTTIEITSFKKQIVCIICVCAIWQDENEIESVLIFSSLQHGIRPLLTLIQKQKDKSKYWLRPKKSLQIFRTSSAYTEQSVHLHVQNLTLTQIGWYLTTVYYIMCIHTIALLIVFWFFVFAVRGLGV